MLKMGTGATVSTDISDDTFGGRLSSARETASMSVETLANQLGVKPETLLAWESDRSEPRPSRLRDLAGILGVSPLWLLTGGGEGPGEVSDERAVESIRMELARLQSAYQDMGRLIESTARQLERLDHQLKLNNMTKGVAH